MAVLVTGYTGLLGRELVSRLRHKNLVVYGLARHHQLDIDCIPLTGDITKPNLGVHIPDDIDAVYHTAALVQLADGKFQQLYLHNYTGTVNVLRMCRIKQIKKLYHVSTAYSTGGRNNYEDTKAWADQEVDNARCWLDITVFKPSIIIGSDKNAYHQFIWLMVQVHRRAELIRRKIEGTLRLPVLEPVFRLKGDGKASLNLIPVDVVADYIINTEKQGIYYITNPNPPILQELVDWIGELVMLKIKFEQEFNMTPIEAVFHKLAESFLPYLQEIYLPCDLKECTILDKQYIQENLKLLFK